MKATVRIAAAQFIVVALCLLSAGAWSQDVRTDRRRVHRGLAAEGSPLEQLKEMVSAEVAAAAAPAGAETSSVSEQDRIIQARFLQAMARVRILKQVLEGFMGEPLFRKWEETNFVGRQQVRDTRFPIALIYDEPIYEKVKRSELVGYEFIDTRTTTLTLALPEFPEAFCKKEFEALRKRFSFLKGAGDGHRLLLRPGRQTWEQLGEVAEEFGSRLFEAATYRPTDSEVQKAREWGSETIIVDGGLDYDGTFYGRKKWPLSRDWDTRIGDRIAETEGRTSVQAARPQSDDSKGPEGKASDRSQ